MRKTTCKVWLCTVFFLLLLPALLIRAQSQPQSNVDQLLKQLETARPDTNKIKLLDKIVLSYLDNDNQMALQYGNQELDLSRHLKWVKGQVMAYFSLSLTYSNSNDNQKALNLCQQGYELARNNNLNYLQYKILEQMGHIDFSMRNYDQATDKLRKATEYFLQTEDLENTFQILGPTRAWQNSAQSLGSIYYIQKKDTAALYFFQQILDKCLQKKDTIGILNALDLLVSYNNYNIKNYSAALKYAIMEQTYFKRSDSSKTKAYSLIQIAYTYGQQNNYVKALEYYRLATELNSDGYTDVKRMANTGMGFIYKSLKDYKNALKIDLEVLETAILNKEENSGLMYLHLYVAQDYRELMVYDQALLYLNKAMELNSKIGDVATKKYLLNQLSRVHYLMHRYDETLMTVNKILDGKEINDIQKNPNLNYLCMIVGVTIRDAPEAVLQKYGILPADRYSQAVKSLQSGLDYYKKANLLDDLQECYKELSITYEMMDDYKGSYNAYKLYIALRDSAINRENQNAFLSKVADLQFEKKEDSLKYQQRLIEEKLQRQTLFSTQQHQALLFNQQELRLLGKEKDLQQLGFLKTQSDLQAEQNRRKANEKQLSLSQKEQALAQTTVQLQKAEIKGKQAQSRYLLAGIAALLVLSFFIGRNYYNQRRSNRLLTAANTQITQASNQISAEKQRSDNLLLNILPADVAEELKEKGSAGARLFEEVTVLFTDFVNFTTISELLTPQELVDELHTCFKAFDGIIGRYDIEKIKTIGDAYLAVAGLPNADPQHAQNTVHAALEIRQFIHDRKERMGNRSFDIRIGIHSGSVVAGIVGVKKFAYDIWGDTVNTAARMEQHSLPGQINLSEKTYELVKDQFAFTYRGEIEAKNKGALRMYFVEKKSASIAVNG